MTQTNNPIFSSLLAEYDARVNAAALRHDEAQHHVAIMLDNLCQSLGEQVNSWFSRIITQKKIVRGYYIWGGVGRGKSMLMDLFFAHAPIKRKKRIHFHAFMIDIHERLRAWRQLGTQNDILLKVVDDIAQDYELLCLDEFQVSDVADAMILSRLFSALWEKDVVVIMTSNRHPRDLYQGGLQREQFLKFVDIAEDYMHFLELKSPHDYRLKQLSDMQQTYVYPLNLVADEFLQASWERFTHNGRSYRLEIPIQGRVLRIDKHNSGIAWLTFDELCVRPLGANDYLELAKLCHTVILQNIPLMSTEYRNEAKRFVTLIDALYEHRVKLIATAADVPQALYPTGDGSFEFARTASRLIEMQSANYMQLAHIA